VSETRPQPMMASSCRTRAGDGFLITIAGTESSSGSGSGCSGWKAAASWYLRLGSYWPEGSTVRGWVRAAMSRTRGAAVVASYRHRLQTENRSQTVLTADS
jgi:hypothetical protein